MKFSIDKHAEGIRFSVEKKVGKSIIAQVCLLLDKSGSFKDEYQSGLVQEVLQHLFPFALVFDPDQSLDLYTFHTEAKERSSITRSNWEGYISHYKLDRDDDWGGTHYAPPLKKALQHYGFIQTTSSGGFLGFGATKTTVIHQNSTDGHPVLCYLVTDGDNSDENQTEALIKNCQENGQNIYFVLVGLDNDRKQSFRFLNYLAQAYDNCGFVSIKNIRQALKEDTFETLMIQDELVQWLKERK
jgi:hypothetical protein